MSYTFSYIKEELLADAKKPFVPFVSGVAEVATFKRFTDLLLKGAICPGVFLDNKKTKDTFMFSQFLYWDFDKGTISSEEVNKRLLRKDISFVIAASKNHLKDKGDGLGTIERFHLLIPLQEPISSVDYIKHLLTEIPKEFSFLQHIDTQCIDATRFFAKHSKLLFVKDISNLLDTDEYAAYYQRIQRYKEVAEKLRKEKREAEIARSGDVDVETRHKALENYLLTCDDSVEGNGGDKQLFKVACQIYRLGGTFNYLQMYNSTKCHPPFQDAQLNHKWKAAEEKNISKPYPPSYIRKVARGREMS